MKNQLPERFKLPSPFKTIIYICSILFIIYSLDGAGISISELIEGFPNMGRILAEMWPPTLSRPEKIAEALLVTFQMAVAGTVLGVIVSLPLGVLASRNQSPHPMIRKFSRGLISFARTVPDLIWALFFVASVGLGPFAGTLALMIDTIGFAGRFFAEAIEEVQPGPEQALAAIGSSWSGRIICAVFPAALPSFIATSLFCLEKATRSSVVLGLVGAGGIGIELKVAMDMFRYAEAAGIILLIFVLVVIVEAISSWARKKII
ncbi:MAG: phosphonate ABC transporter, permease protein PhnE [Bdellovibrionales bacterium]|nr:phosphonate ABC transporter, permease protein PhnE [Bdellovibrionales bacterium]